MHDRTRARFGAQGKKLGATALVAAGLVAGSVGVATAATASGSTPSGTARSGTSGSASTEAGTTGPGSAPRPGSMPRPRRMLGRGGPGGPESTVTAVTATSLTVTTPTGRTVTYALTSSTKYRKDGAKASASAVTDGELVVVRTAGPPAPPAPSSSSAASPTAIAVVVVSPHVAGLVHSITTSGTSSTIVVTDAQGFWHTIVTSSASTTYTDNGKSVTSPTITTGMFVVATGTIASNHTTLDATTVHIGIPTPPARGSMPRPPAPPVAPAGTGQSGG